MNQLELLKRRLQKAHSNKQLDVPKQPEIETGTGANNKPLPSSVASAVNKVIAKQSGEDTLKSKHEVGYDDLNDEQKYAVRLSSHNDSFCLIGSAGTGKTTTIRVIAQHLLMNGQIGRLTQGTKNIAMGAPSIAVVSFTNVAVKNIRSALPDEFKRNCLTIHKLLEYHPEFYEVPVVEDGEETGEWRTTMRYEPTYGKGRELLPNFTHIVIEEAGSVPTHLYDELYAACPDATFIYLGDLQQLPPVMGQAILGFKLLEHPVVELKQTYRQIGDSPILDLAYRILEGRPIGDRELATFNRKTDSGEVLVKKFAKYIPDDIILQPLGSSYSKLVKAGEFVCGRDVVLCPYNVGLGVIELNKYIAQARAEMEGAPTYEVIAGLNTFYFAEGDHIMWDKEQWTIKDIKGNTQYFGKRPLAESIYLDRWGHNRGNEKLSESDLGFNDVAIDNLLEMDLSKPEKKSEEKDDRVHQCSHILVLQHVENPDFTMEIKSANDINNIIFTYALTVHKSQGSEWDNVYFLMHHKHSHMACRELLYTAVTRARKKLVIQYDGEVRHKLGNSIFQKGVTAQKLKGNTLEQKLNYFRAKLKAMKIKEAIELKKSR